MSWRDALRRVPLFRTARRPSLHSCGTVLSGLKRLSHGSVAQSVEQRPFKALVPGSSPGRPNFLWLGSTFCEALDDITSAPLKIWIVGLLNTDVEVITPHAVSEKNSCSRQRRKSLRWLKRVRLNVSSNGRRIRSSQSPR